MKNPAYTGLFVGIGNRIYLDADSAAAEGVHYSIGSDQFYGQPLAGSMRIILEMRRGLKQGPASLNEIYDALVQGGFKFDSNNEENRKRNLRISLGKNIAVFHKLPNGLFGLTEWYPKVKDGSKRRSDAGGDDDDSGGQQEGGAK